MFTYFQNLRKENSEKIDSRKTIEYCTVYDDRLKRREKAEILLKDEWIATTPYRAEVGYLVKILATGSEMFIKSYDAKDAIIFGDDTINNISDL